MCSPCDEKASDNFFCHLKATINELRQFGDDFFEVVDEQIKLAKDLWIWVSRYNIIDEGPPCIYPIVQKEELMQEMLVSIQELTATIYQTITCIERKFRGIEVSRKKLESKLVALDWNPTTNPSIKHSVKYLPPSHCVDDISEIIFQYDIAISYIFQYVDALDLRDAKSYENFMKSFITTLKIKDSVNECLIKHLGVLTL